MSKNDIINLGQITIPLAYTKSVYNFLISKIPDIMRDLAVLLEKDEETIKKYIVDTYYEYEPSMYTNRMGSLYDAIDIKVEATNDDVLINDIKNYNIPQHTSNSKWHKSGGEWVSRSQSGFDFDSDSNGMPENKWIVDNFYEGIHPIYKVNNFTRELIDKSVTTDDVEKSLEIAMDKSVKKIIPEMDRVLRKYIEQALTHCIGGGR